LKTPLTIIFVITLFLESSAQHFTHDIGVFIGANNFQTDYSKKDDISSQLTTDGISFSIAHYLHFFKKKQRWTPNSPAINHLMVRSDITFNSQVQLQHTGSNITNSPKEEAMRGTINMFGIGVSLEYYLFSLPEFVYPYSQRKYNPFIKAGFRYSMFTNNLQSDLPLPNLFIRDPASLNVGSGNIPSIMIGVGTRYKLTEKLDFSTQFTAHYFLSDGIDALQAQIPQNRVNDSYVNIQFGVVYHLNFNSPLSLRSLF
jgi:hypothetical protein